MNKKVKIIFMIVVIILVGVVIYLSIDMTRKVEEIRKNNIKSDNINGLNNIINEYVKTNNIQEESNDIKNEIINNNLENTVQDNNETQENTSSEIIENEQDAEKIAINIVKQNWGNDNNVYFSYDGIDSNDKYIIAVRDKATTQVLAWYEVDVKSKTFTKR